MAPPVDPQEDGGNYSPNCPVPPQIPLVDFSFDPERGQAFTEAILTSPGPIQDIKPFDHQNFDGNEYVPNGALEKLLTNCMNLLKLKIRLKYLQAFLRVDMYMLRYLINWEHERLQFLRSQGPTLCCYSNGFL
jgi:hypothetical protein